MYGRLGMTGKSVGRGDKDVVKALADKKLMVFMGAKGTRARRTQQLPSGAEQRLRRATYLSPQRRERIKQMSTDPIIRDQVKGPQANNARMAQTMADHGGPYTARSHGAHGRKWDLEGNNMRPEIQRGMFRKAATTMSDAEAAKVKRQYGLAGPLPKQLNREGRMRAYEGRYVAAGGRKGEKWNRRRKGAEVVRNAGVATATTGAIGILASRNKHAGKILTKLKVKPHHLETAGLSAAAAGGSAELYGQYAQHKRSKYTNAPAGVARSALTRMQAYTPEKS